MSPERRELLCLRVSDGLASDAEVEELRVAGEDVDALVALRALLSEALHFEPMEDPGFADDVMAAVGAPDSLGALLREALDPGPLPDLSFDVLDAIDGAPLSAYADGQLAPAEQRAMAARLASDPAAAAQVAATARLSAVFAEAVRAEAGPAPQLWSGVAASLGLDPEHVPGWNGAMLADAVRAEAGTVDLVQGVLARLPARRPAAANAAPGWRRWFDTLSLPAFGLAAAAALLLAFPAIQADRAGALSFQVAPINHVQIEDLSSDAPNAMVQVLQMDADAPTIIFIEEVPAQDQGATL